MFEDSDDKAEPVPKIVTCEFEKCMNYQLMAENLNNKEFKLLTWWKNNAPNFPLMAKMARSVLCIPASSAESERVFSAASNTISEKRSHVLPDNLNDLLLLKSNSQFIQ